MPRLTALSPLLAIVIGGVGRENPAVVSVPAANVAASTQVLPPSMPFDPHWHLGTIFGDHKIGNFVRQDLNGKFQAGKVFKAKPESGNVDCDVRIQAANNTGNLSANPNKKTDWYPIALLTNESPADCTPRALAIAKGETAIWIARFEGGSHSGEVSVGDAGVVVIAPPNSGKDKWSVGKKWSFKQCGHTGSPHDDSMIWVNKDVCKETKTSGHNADTVAVHLAQLLAAKTVFDWNDPILWFACGGDCCYSDLGK